MSEEKFWFGFFCLAVQLAMFIVPLLMILDIRKRNKNIYTNLRKEKENKNEK